MPRGPTSEAAKDGALAAERRLASLQGEHESDDIERRRITLRLIRTVGRHDVYGRI